MSEKCLVSISYSLFIMDNTQKRLYGNEMCLLNSKGTAHLYKELTFLQTEQPHTALHWAFFGYNYNQKCYSKFRIFSKAIWKQWEFNDLTLSKETLFCWRLGRTFFKVNKHHLCTLIQDSCNWFNKPVKKQMQAKGCLNIVGGRGERGFKQT